jgi:hypothetical protein
MKPNLRALEKWRDRLHIVGHPIRLSILIMLYGAEVIERQKVEKRLTHNYPIGFLKYYIKTIRSALPVIRTLGFSALMYYLVVWPMKFFIYLKMGKGILMPFSVKK